jgi:D-arabinose 1-dehydrogenase-like Zn-dependent alcohol dehydrogenase
MNNISRINLEETIEILLTLDNETLQELMKIIRKKGDAVMSTNYSTAALLREEEKRIYSRNNLPTSTYLNYGTMEEVMRKIREIKLEKILDEEV